MKKKYIVQIKRRYFWEDLITLYDKNTAFMYLLRLRNLEKLNIRLLEVLCVM